MKINFTFNSGFLKCFYLTGLNLCNFFIHFHNFSGAADKTVTSPC